METKKNKLKGTIWYWTIAGCDEIYIGRDTTNSTLYNDSGIAQRSKRHYREANKYTMRSKNRRRKL